MTAGPTREARRPRGAPGTQVARAEVILARTAALFRLGGLCQLVFALATVGGQFRGLGPPLCLAAIVFGESAVVIRLWWRRMDTRVLTADVVFWTAALIVEAGIPTGRSHETWAFYMYPFSLLSCVAIGIGYRRLRTVLIATGCVMLGYFLAVSLLQNTPWWNALPNSLSYAANTVITWLVARELRRSARAADAAEARSLARAAELAAERESARYARELHDRVLQTLEMLARGRWIDDAEVRRQVAGEAVWLRGMITGNARNGPDDLLTALHTVVREQACRGIHVEVNDAGLTRTGNRPRLPVPTIEAVCGAVREAITNVGKHAEVDAAVLRIGYDRDGCLVVSVVDRGTGFDPAVPAGERLGLHHSVRDRIASVGGTVHIDSAPGCGTHVELRVPTGPVGG